VEWLKYSHQPETLTFDYTEYQNEIKATYIFCGNNTATKLAITVPFYFLAKGQLKGQNLFICISL
jgi:hypothetical protein